MNCPYQRVVRIKEVSVRRGPKKDPQAVAKRKPEKKSRFNRIQAHDLCDAGAVLYQPRSSELGAGHTVSS